MGAQHHMTTIDRAALEALYEPSCKAIDTLCDQITEEHRRSLHFLYNGPFSRIESPIERLFIISCVEVLRFDLSEVLAVIFPGDPRKTRNQPFNGYWADCQVVIIDNWPVDFVLWHSEAPNRRLVVECDGHDSHATEKWQAARDRGRDRKLQELGYTVYRFTGSELWNDPLGRARQALRWVFQ